MFHYHMQSLVSFDFHWFFFYVSVPLTLDDIFTEVQKTENGRVMTMERVRSSLVQLGCTLGNDSYSIGANMTSSSYLMFSCVVKHRVTTVCF